MSLDRTEPVSCSRDHHLFGPGPKRILALDGGGIRGAITVAFLERIEELLDRQAGHEVRLADYFDLIGGTSIGSFIATALALGHRVEYIKTFYEQRAHLAFKKTPRWHLPLLSPKFDATGLRAEIERVVKDCTLGDEKQLKTGLCIVTKRLDTGSPWVITNSPKAPYWETPKPDPLTGKPEYIGNRHFRLSNVVRASTAAPHYYDPEMLPIVGEPLSRTVAAPFDQPLWVRAGHWALERLGLQTPPSDLDGYGMFIDGGVTPYNNPSLALLLVATLGAFGLRWSTGPDQLALVSIGTGMVHPRVSYDSLRFLGRVKLAFHALLSVMSDIQTLTLAQMQWLGETAAPWTINSEFKKLEGDRPGGGKLFRFFRFDIRLEQKWLAEKLGTHLSAKAVDELRKIDNPKSVGPLYELAKLAAKHQIREEDWRLQPSWPRDSP
jgi:uncharacterized protein